MNEFYQVLRVLYYLLYGKKCTISERYIPRSYIVPYEAGFLFFFNQLYNVAVFDIQTPEEPGVAGRGMGGVFISHWAHCLID